MIKSFTFGVDSLTHVAKAVHHHCETLHKSIIHGNSGEAVLKKMDEISNNLVSFVDLTEVLARLHTDVRVRGEAGKVNMAMHKYMQELNQRGAVFELLRGEIPLLSGEARYVAEAAVDDYKHFCGTKDAERCLMGSRRAQVKYEKELTLKALYELLRSRQALAEQYSQPSYAHLVMRRRIINDPQVATALLAELFGQQAEQSSMKEKRGFIAFSETIGLFVKLLSDWGIKVEVGSERLWTDLLTLRMSVGGSLVGEIHLDLLRLADSCNEPTHFTIKTRNLSPSILYQEKHAIVLIAYKHFTPDHLNDRRPLTRADAEMLFHELGHGVHSVVSETEFHHLSGTRGALDYVEFPSILFEYLFCSMTGSEGASRSNARSDIRLAIADLCLHTTSLSSFADFQSLLHRTAERVSLQSIPMTSHLGGYGSAYYAYPLCRHIASLMHTKYFSKDPSANGGILLSILGKGGSVDPKSLLRPHLPDLVSKLETKRSLLGLDYK